jgi:hypothetical protein
MDSLRNDIIQLQEQPDSTRFTKLTDSLHVDGAGRKSCGIVTMSEFCNGQPAAKALVLYV